MSGLNAELWLLGDLLRIDGFCHHSPMDWSEECILSVMSDYPIPDGPSIDALLDLAAGVDFLIRARHQPQAALAADQLALWLLHHYRELQTARHVMSADHGDVLARKVVIAIVEAKSLAGNARAGRAPDISRLRSLVQDLHRAEAAAQN